MTSIKKNHVVNCINYANENRLFDKLNNIYKSLPSGDCSGCGNCCMESVGTNLIEFINIYNYLENKPELKKMCLDKIIDYYFLEYIDKKPCPFKDKDNRCMIYEVRPLNCRLFGHWKKEDYNKNLMDRIKMFLDIIFSKEIYELDDYKYNVVLDMASIVEDINELSKLKKKIVFYNRLTDEDFEVNLDNSVDTLTDTSIKLLKEGKSKTLKFSENNSNNK